jgi:hypothetical protein
LDSDSTARRSVAWRAASDYCFAAMPSESFFLAFGGLGLSLAGFAGVISALKPGLAGDSLVTGYRIRTIVFLGLSLTFVGFGTVAAYSVTDGDLVAAVRVGTLLMLVPFFRGLLIDTRPGPAWPREPERWFSIVVVVVLLALTIANLVVASVGFLQILMILGLIGPVSIFYNTIRDATQASDAVEAALTEYVSREADQG